MFKYIFSKMLKGKDSFTLTSHLYYTHLLRVNKMRFFFLFFLRVRRSIMVVLTRKFSCINNVQKVKIIDFIFRLVKPSFIKL
jgi:hypothetical protein